MGVPTYMYRKNAKGEVEAQVFDSDNIPKGWVDSPEKVEKPKRGRPKKAE